MFSVFCGVVFYGVDRIFLKWFFVLCLVVLFLLLVGIVVGKGFEGCIFGFMVVNCFNGI